MRDYTVFTFACMACTLAAGFIGMFLFGPGIPALASAGVGFVVGCWALPHV